MLKTYREEMIIRSRDCDSEGTLRPSTLLAALQDVADVHARLLGCGREVLIEQTSCGCSRAAKYTWSAIRKRTSTFILRRSPW